MKTFITQKGFTLIELLVVVLIIGILSAIALPRYQTAVDKSRAATVWPVLKTYREAFDVCLLANNGSSNNCGLDSLDVELPEIDCNLSFAQGTCTFMIGGSNSVLWGSLALDFALGIASDGTRFCVENEEGCKKLGFSVKQEGFPFGSWSTEYTEN